MGRLRLLEFHCRFRFWNPRRLDHEQRPGAYRDAELESAARGTAGRDQLESHHPYFGLAHQLLPRTDGRIWRRRGGIARNSDPDHERVEIAGAVYFFVARDRHDCWNYSDNYDDLDRQGPTAEEG